MSTRDQMLRALARVRRHGEQINVELRSPVSPQEAKALRALQGKVRASMRRAVAEDGARRTAHQERQDGERVLRVAEVMKVTGLGRTTLWKLEREGQFPKRVRITGRAVGWRASDVARWVAGCYSVRGVERG